MADVIDMEEFRITRKSRYEPKQCLHTDIVIDPNGEIVECNQCEKQISAFSAFSAYIEHYRKARDKLIQREKELREMEQSKVILKAALKIQGLWRSRTMLPCCPHCYRGILPTDGLASVNKDMELHRRAFKDKKIDPGK